MDFKEILKEVFFAEGINLTEKEADRFAEYCRFLKEYNQKVNLTAITDEKEIAVKHFLDSSMVLKLMEIKEGADVIDVGTGAGFPSVPVKILKEDINLTLLDSLSKRLKFLEQLLQRLDLKADMVHARAEQKGACPPMREGFDIAFSRAVASLSALAEYCLPFVRVGGTMAALKGPKADEEINEAEGAIKLLGGGNLKKLSYNLSDGSERSLILIEKIMPTPKKYPRQRVKIGSSPLK